MKQRTDEAMGSGPGVAEEISPDTTPEDSAGQSLNGSESGNVSESNAADVNGSDATMSESNGSESNGAGGEESPKVAEGAAAAARKAAGTIRTRARNAATAASSAATRTPKMLKSMAASGSEETSAKVAAPEEAHDETDSAALAVTSTETPAAAVSAETASPDTESAEAASAQAPASSAASAKAALVEKMWPTEAWPPKTAKTPSGDSDGSTGTKARRGGSPLPPADALPADTLRSPRERSTFATPPAGKYEGTTYSVPPMPAPATAPSPAPSPAAAKPTPPMPSATGPAPRAGQTVQRRKPTRQAHLSVARLEPWSVMKFSFVISLVCFVILIVAVTALYGVLASLGVFDSLQHVVNSVTSSQNSAGVNAAKWFSASKVLGYTGLIGAMNVVLITAMATIGAVIYNLTSGLVGGIEVTLRETE